MSAILEVSGISKSFAGLRALSDVGFTVDRGSILGIIGPNGAGKTTLFNALCGSVKPDTGTVQLRGKDITGRSAHRTARDGMVRTFQLMRPFATMSVRDNVAIAAQGRHRRSAALAHADEVLARVGLADLRGVQAADLSTAHLKRLELARALATGPEVLLLDEVLAGLVPAEREPVLELLLELRESGTTLLFVEHVMAAVMRLSDRVLVLDQGRVLMQGSPTEVTSDPRVVEAYLGGGFSDAGP
jgi:branched-chain amino acid transport system ATP-binding protein